VTTPTLPTVIPCTLCNREQAIGRCCWPCHHHLADLLSDRAGSDWNPNRPSDPYVPPGIGWLLRALHAHDGQRAVRPEPGGPRGFGPSSPADDHVIALRDPRTQLDGEFVVLAGGRWLGCSARELAEREDVRTARDELRATQRHLLAVLGDGHGARLVGYCRQVVEAAACSAPLWCPPQPPHGDDEASPIPPSVRCPSCLHVYGGLSLARMGRVDVEEAAA
jgi:hypothetical protein